jgi:hypothetical protein
MTNTTQNDLGLSLPLAPGSTIPGLKKAIKIVENREATAKALIYDEVYMACFKDLLIFLRAELWRQENPEEAKKSQTTTAEFR